MSSILTVFGRLGGGQAGTDVGGGLHGAGDGTRVIHHAPTAGGFEGEALLAAVGKGSVLPGTLVVAPAVDAARVGFCRLHLVTGICCQIEKKPSKIFLLARKLGQPEY